LIHFLEILEAFNWVSGVRLARPVVRPTIGAVAVDGDNAESYDGLEAFKLVYYVYSMGPGAAEVEVEGLVYLSLCGHSLIIISI
jgi:hypothetical protein